jgi:VanZ family protein
LDIKVKKITAWVCVFAWMILILSLSSDPADVSKEKSKAIEQLIRESIQRIQERFEVRIIDVGDFEFHVRKAAHMVIYFVLGILLMLATKISGIGGRKAYFFGFLVGALFAGMDETYQNFIPGRSGEVRDVMIDSAGVLIGLAFYGLIIKKRCKS